MELAKNPTTAAPPTKERIQKLSDECLELEIQAAGKQLELANLMIKNPRYEYFGLAGERDLWRMKIESLVAMRSPERIAQMEVERGLAALTP